MDGSDRSERERLSGPGLEVLKALVLGLPLEKGAGVWTFGVFHGAPATVPTLVVDELRGSGFICVSAKITEAGRVALRRNSELAHADVAAWLNTENDLLD